MIRKVMCIDDDNITLTLCELVIKKAEFANEVLICQAIVPTKKPI